MGKDHDRVERQARRFAEQLRPTSDCPEPLPCGTCFLAFTASLDAANLEHVRNKCPEFYDVLLGIVLREPVLSEEECAVLCARIVAYETTSCPNCAARSEGPVERNAPRLEPPFEVAYNQCCLAIAMCVNPSEQEKAYSRTRKRPFRSGYWPDTTARLLPLGAAQSIHRLVRSATWYRGAVSLLSATLQRYRYHVFQEIIKDSLLVRRTISVLERQPEMPDPLWLYITVLAAHRSR
ncbi:hypothetical protein EXIGLDRAFT_498669 [Exidia glandulosa HHB12029]|uniref:Uncharacterized protein n=1 Tax=Exidia glandulosa HHB12029 TaxID=1314781 RepID=A0A165JFL8_EXIGL|nr:hypothetical protein EXIGLDRAFT_498669 [Exidia glandulosa HHB12029]